MYIPLFVQIKAQPACTVTQMRRCHFLSCPAFNFSLSSFFFWIKSLCKRGRSIKEEKLGVWKSQGIVKMLQLGKFSHLTPTQPVWTSIHLGTLPQSALKPFIFIIEDEHTAHLRNCTSSIKGFKEETLILTLWFGKRKLRLILLSSCNPTQQLIQKSVETTRHFKRRKESIIWRVFYRSLSRHK